MSKQIFKYSTFILSAAIFPVIFMAGCAVEAAKNEAPGGDQTGPKRESVSSETKNATKGALIKIEPNSPADTVRVFYKDLREQRFREAMFLTNLRPAIEGLTDDELKEFQFDFEAIGRQIPTAIEINGEITSGNYSTVTAKLPDNKTGKLGVQQIRLRKETDYWVILTVDETAETAIKKEGNKYFYNLRMATHHHEAETMLDRVSKAQMIYALQNGGVFGEMETLIEKGFLPDDILSADSTGYNYKIVVSEDKKEYYAAAEPAVYGKTGKLSYVLELDGKRIPRLKSKDMQGKAIK